MTTNNHNHGCIGVELFKAVCGRCGLFINTTTTDRCHGCNARYDFVPFRMIELDPAIPVVPPPEPQAPEPPAPVALIDREPDECEHGPRKRVTAPVPSGPRKGEVVTVDFCALYGESRPVCDLIDTATESAFDPWTVPLSRYRE